MVLRRGPSNEHTKGSEHREKRTYHHKAEMTARGCLSNVLGLEGDTLGPKLTLFGTWHFAVKLAPLQIIFSADFRMPPSEMLSPHSKQLLFSQPHLLIFYLAGRIRNASLSQH